MDFPVDDGVSCLVTNAMKIKKAFRCLVWVSGSGGVVLVG